MALTNITDHVLEIGDKVKMNIPVLARGDLDGVEITNSGKNYWKYICSHPEEIYTVTGFDFDQDPCIYILSGFLGDNTWAKDELIYIPEAKNQFEILKNMTIDEAPDIIFNMIHDLCEDGIPSPEHIREWLENKPNTEA